MRLLPRIFPPTVCLGLLTLLAPPALRAVQVEATESIELTIVQADEAGEEEKAAAELLLSVLEKLYPGQVALLGESEVPATGRRIYVGLPGPDPFGKEAVEGLDRDGFVLIRPHPWQARVGPRRYQPWPPRHRAGAGDRWLAIVGASPRGTYYGAAYVLQEGYGVRWLFPGEDGLDLPDRPGPLLTGLEGVVEPSFDERSLGHGQTPEQKEWAKVNGLGSRYSYIHNLHRLTDKDAFEAHPSWQSTIGGRRQTELYSQSAQPNLADAGYAAHIAQRARRFFNNNPDEPSLSLATTDSTSFDQSAATRSVVEPFTYFRGRPNYSDLVFGFTNQVAVQLFEDEQGGDKYADQVLTQLAYYYAEEVPKLKLHPQIMPWLTSDRAEWFDPDYRREDKALIRRWVRTGVNKLGAWDYYEGIPYFIPRYYPTIIGESLPYLHEQGISSFFAEGIRNPGLDDPKYWLAAQLLWDVDQDSEALLNEYFERCYREAAEPMRRFFDLCEQAWMNQPPPGRWIKYFNSPSQAELFPPEVMERLRACLDEAQALAGSDRVRRRIERVSESFNMTEVALARYQVWKRLAAQPRSTSADAAEWLATEPALKHLLTGKWRRSMALFFLLRSDPTHRGTPPPANTPPVLQETFTELLVPNGRVAAPAQRRLSLTEVGERQWGLTMWHSEAMRLEQSSEAARESGQGLRVEGAEELQLTRGVEVRPGQQLYVRAWCRGRLSGDAQVYINVRLLDAEGSYIGIWNMDALPPGEHGWLPLTAVVDVPTGAVQAILTVSVQHQGPGDWIDWDDIELYLSSDRR